MKSATPKVLHPLLGRTLLGHVLVDVGLRCSQVIIGKGHDISFYKPIDVGGKKFNEAVSRKLGISLEEACERPLHRSERAAVRL